VLSCSRILGSSAKHHLFMSNPSERLPSAVLDVAAAAKNAKKLPRRRSIIREFSLNTTAHGLPGIARSESRHNCIFWSVASIVFLGVMVFFVVQAIISYFQFPTSMDSSILSERPQNFPAVSFCNISPLRLDRIWQPLLNYSVANNLTSGNDAASSQAQFQNIVKFITYTLNRNDSIKPLLYPLSSMLFSCRFNDRPCFESDFISFTSAVYGSCYTFNAKLKNTNGQKLLTANEYGGDGKLSIGLYIHRHQYIPYIADGK
jgi:hypothetical protein